MTDHHHSDNHDPDQHHDREDHHHDHDSSPSDIEAKVRALHSLLLEKNMISNNAVEEAIAAYEEDIGPQNGARVVSKAWTDPKFRELLLADGTTAVQEFDFEMGSFNIEFVENTPDTHNVIVCTLCSCYPWSLLGPPPTWYKSPAYRARIVREPRSVLEEFGLSLDPSVDVTVWDSNSEVRYAVLPQRPPGADTMSESKLVQLVTRDSMVGVERLGVD